MRLLHSSDWHLGRSFFGCPLLEDQALALDSLVALAVEARVDAVLIAGDVYDRSSPPADAVKLLDETLTRLVVAHGIPVVMIAGNHDSGERLGFASRLLQERGLHVAGSEPLLALFGDTHGAVEVLALPFAEAPAVAARRKDPSILDHDAAMRAEIAAFETAGELPETQPARAAASVRATPQRSEDQRVRMLPREPAAGPAPARHRKATTVARRRIAVAHAFVAGGTTSESERPLVMGNAALVEASCFDAFSYAALGHLHRPQQAGREAVRYSGSLLKYSFDEASHRKGVAIVEIDAVGDCRIEQVPLALRRDVRVLEGTLEELQRAAEKDFAREDYVLAKLLDREAVLDPIGKLRLLYPNCLRVDREAFFAKRLGGEVSAAGANPLRRSEADLFEAFFREVTGEAPGEEEARVFASAVAAIRQDPAGS